MTVYYYGGGFSTKYIRNTKYYDTVLRIFDQEFFFYVGVKIIL